MKKMLLVLRWPCLLQDVLNRRLLFKNKPAAVVPKETITHHFFVSDCGRKLRCMPKFVAAQKMLLKQETQQTFVNGLLGFITLGIYTPLEARVLTIIHELPIVMGGSICTAH